MRSPNEMEAPQVRINPITFAVPNPIKTASTILVAEYEPTPSMAVTLGSVRSVKVK